MSAFDMIGTNASQHPRASRRVPAGEMFGKISQTLTRQGRPSKLLVYIHVPFCSSKCSFCSWVSGISTAELRSADETRWRYVRAIENQIEYFGPRLASLGYIPEIVYWGGGTPSMFNPDQIAAVGTSLLRNFDLSHVREYSVEASPETLSAEKIATFRAIGMNRLSIGVQSFHPHELRRAGRAHSADDAESAIRLAKAKGCTNLNIDIITGFPKQTPEILGETLERTLKLRPEHITAYTYHAANGTVMARQLARGHLADAGADERAKAMDHTYNALVKAGYSQYMPMYYSVGPAHRFAADSYYFEWEGDHIGLGSGANSILATHLLYNRRGRLEEYIASPVACDRMERMGQRKALDDTLELLLRNGLRLDFERFDRRFGFDFETLLDLPLMRAWRRLLDRLHAPLTVTGREAYISPPDGGWHGGELLRLRTAFNSVQARLAAAASSRRPPGDAGAIVSTGLIED